MASFEIIDERLDPIKDTYSVRMDIIEDGMLYQAKHTVARCVIEGMWSNIAQNVRDLGLYSSIKDSDIP
jgi:hypothetical protein